MSLVMFGLDGADPELVRKWEDELPNFQKLMKEGFFGDLESIMPPITVPAWACMLSSRTPNYFKVSHFQKMNPENYEREVVLSEAFRPEIIFDSDWESISYLIPGTTPAYAINGSMVSGYLTGDDLEFSPQSLEKSMKRNTNIEIEKAKGDMKEEAIETFNNSFDGFRWLIKNQDFDIALSAFQLIDFSMHSKASESLKDEYKAVDEKLGELINICNENDWDLIVASDHGSAESDRKLYINAWLRKNGYLAYSKQNSSAGEDIKYKIGDLLLDLGLKDVAKKGLNIYKRITGNDPTPSNSIKDNIKLSESKAFSEFASGMNATGIYIHDERFPQGIVEDREKVAKSIKSDLEKEDFVEKVYMDEELLEIDRMPDLIVETNESVGIGSSFYPQLFHNTKAAIHNKKGLIGGIGSSFKSGVSVDAHIIDVKPTIEATLGEVSVDNQGEVIDEVLADISYEEKVDIGNIEI